MKSTFLSLQGFSQEHALQRILNIENIDYKKTIFYGQQNERFELLGAHILKSIGGFILFDTGLKIGSLINDYNVKIKRDKEINTLIEKNQSILAKLKEIQQAV